jgi:uncharacterized membrane protein YhaH (DUF805 family)
MPEQQAQQEPSLRAKLSIFVHVHYDTMWWVAFVTFWVGAIMLLVVNLSIAPKREKDAEREATKTGKPVTHPSRLFALSGKGTGEQAMIIINYIAWIVFIICALLCIFA